MALVRSDPFRDVHRLLERTIEAVPPEDRQEQRMPPECDLRTIREHPLDRPVADALEQEIPVADVTEITVGIDDDRLEPIDETEWYDEGETPL